MNFPFSGVCAYAADAPDAIRTRANKHGTCAALRGATGSHVGAAGSLRPWLARHRPRSGSHVGGATEAHVRSYVVESVTPVLLSVEPLSGALHANRRPESATFSGHFVRLGARDSNGQGGAAELVRAATAFDPASSPASSIEIARTIRSRIWQRRALPVITSVSASAQRRRGSCWIKATHGADAFGEASPGFSP